jgi:hypothetical protein
MMTERAQKLSQAIKEVSWDWENMQPSHPHTIAIAALRETINILQDGSGMIAAPDMLKLAEEIENL